MVVASGQVESPVNKPRTPPYKLAGLVLLLVAAVVVALVWTQFRGGFANGELGRIGLNAAPSNPSIIYAQVEGPEGRGGTYRSTDNGACVKRSRMVS